jgi:lysozyme
MTRSKRLSDMLIKHEGKRNKPYECTAGKLTIGVGRNLDDMGLTEDEVLYLLDNDIQRCDTELLHNFKWYSDLCRARQDALINLCFNIGITRLLTFTHSLSYMEAEDYEKAADEFLNSRWAEQVGNRAIEVTELIRTGRY